MARNSAFNKSAANFILIFAALSSSVVSAQDLVGIASIIDGDTIEIHGIHIRMLGIDAPESHQLCQNTDGTKWLCGQKSAHALSDKIAQGTVDCSAGKKDLYQRTVAQCSLGDVDLNQWMVANGWALAYRQYSKKYVGDEAAAQKAKLGIWGSKFTPPWQWRKEKRGHLPHQY